MEYVDPYDFEMEPVIQHSSSEADNNMSSSEIYSASVLTSSMINTPLMNDKLAKSRS